MKVYMRPGVLHFLIIFITLAGPVKAQGPEKPAVPTSPTAASLGLFGQVEADYFNGLPVVNIPVYNIKNSSIAVPINLMYHASGVRPDIHAGWVGLNWSLNCNFSINRILNGDPDEVVIAPGWLYSNHPNGQSYLDNYAVLNRSDWNSVPVLNQYLTNYLNPATDDDKDHRPIPAPDEFSFNFLGFSGSFFLDHTGVWKFKCDNDGGLKLDNVDIGEFNLPPLPPFQDNLPGYKKRMFRGFTLVDGSGTKYIFGGDVNTVEFSRYGVTNTVFDDYGNYTFAISWYLKKIVTVNNEQVNFEYEKSSRYQVNYSDSWDNTSFSNSFFSSTSTGPGSNVVKNLINPVYLKQIDFDDGYVEFAISECNDLLPAPPIAGETYEEFAGYRDLQNGAIAPRHYKLDNIIVHELNGDIKKTFQFVYEEVTTKRLMLKELRETGVHGEQLKHQFAYYEDDLNPLPNYLSRQLDHWGFWNGRNWFREQLPRVTYSQADLPSYTASREPNFSFAVLGTLQKITYPTGGYTQFTYELNDYNGLINYYGRNYLTTFNSNYGIDYELLSGSPRLAGGLRIKEIDNFDAVRNLNNSRRFEYKKNATESSGILHGLPQYSENGTWHFNLGGTLDYFRWFNYSIQPFGLTKGNHITYSQVKEIFPDNSYIIRKYNNQDDIQYRDKVLDAIVANTMFGSSIPCNSMELERGLLRTEEFHSANDNIVKKTDYDYNNDPGRFDNYIRQVDFKIMQVDPAKEINDLMDYGAITLPLTINQVYAYKKYIYSEKISRTAETTYDPTGSQNIQTEKNIIYNTDGNIKQQSSVTSDGKLIKTAFKYPGDYPGTANDDAARGIQFLKQKGVNNAVIESITTQSDLDGNNPVIIAATLNLYKKDQAVIDKIYAFRAASPVSYATSFDSYIDGNGAFQFNTGYEVKTSFATYDVYGNPLVVKNVGQPVISYLWEAGRPFAICTGADNNSIAYTSFEDFNFGNWSGVDGVHIMDGGGISGQKYYSLDGFQLARTGLNIGLTYIVSYWSKNGSYSVNGATGTAGRGMGGWTYFEHRVTPSNGTITIAGSGSIDELRLFPANAIMATYTFDPILGLTSQCDTRNIITYYEYDGLGRLLRIRDADNNILKQFDYKYQVGVSDANWLPTSNYRCTVGDGGYSTGHREQEQKDDNPYSSSYNNTRWADIGVNINSCPVIADWQVTGTSRCQVGTGGYSTGHREQEQKDHNPYSASYNTTRWVDIGVNSGACPVNPDWQATGNYRCIKNVDGDNTGEQEQEERDMNPYSTSANTIRWDNLGMNTVSCPLPFVYAKLTYENQFGNYADVVVRFYADAACTIPASVSNLVVNFMDETNNDISGEINHNYYSQTCNGTETTLLYSTPLVEPVFYNGFNAFLYHSYMLQYGNGYVLL